MGKQDTFSKGLYSKGSNLGIYCANIWEWESPKVAIEIDLRSIRDRLLNVNEAQYLDDKRDSLMNNYNECTKPSYHSTIKLNGY